MKELTRSYAIVQDDADPLKHFKNHFYKPGEDLIYLDGNSLGMLPCATRERLQNVVDEEWGRGLIRSWNTGWYNRSDVVAAKIACLIGAKPHEVMVGDSTSVNLYKLAYAALFYQKERKVIVSDNLNFPSDLYIFQGLVRQWGADYQLRLASSVDAIGIDTNALAKVMSEDVALVSLSHVVFKSAFMYDMEQVTRLAQENGSMILWDLSHAVGAVPIDLNGAHADLAVGCTYKYLNGGPGAPAFLYVREDLQEKLETPIYGWFGQNNPFAFSLEYEPAPGIARFLAGTPPLLSLSALEPSLDILLEAGMNRIRKKSVEQSKYLIRLAEHFLFPLGYTLASPCSEEQRGSHISMRHPEAYRICQALIDPGVGGNVVIPDFREPDNIRLGIAPLYNSFADIFDTVWQMKSIVTEKKYLPYSSSRKGVT